MIKYKVEILVENANGVFEYRPITNSSSKIYIFDTPEEAWMGVSYGYSDRYSRVEYPINSVFSVYGPNYRKINLRIISIY